MRLNFESAAIRYRVSFRCPMPERSRSRSVPADARRVPPPMAVARAAAEKEKLRDRLLAMILRNETLRKQAPR